MVAAQREKEKGTRNSLTDLLGAQVINRISYNKRSLILRRTLSILKRPDRHGTAQLHNCKLTVTPDH